MRHGQTLFNLRKKIQGACDSPLTELGIKPDIVAGVSAGSVVAVLTAGGMAPEKIVELFAGLEYRGL